MSEEFCAGVKILLKRIESHPEEFMKEFSPWKRLMDAVIANKLDDFDDRYYLRALTNQEIDALYGAFLPMIRQEFDEWVMREVLAEPMEEKHWAAKQMQTFGWNDPRMLTQNTIRPGSIIPVGGAGGGGSGQVKLGGIREIEREGVMRRIQNSIKELRKQIP